MKAAVNVGNHVIRALETAQAPADFHLEKAENVRQMSGVGSVEL
jgi:hypothetical protein